jgi:enterobactin synthetase component D
LWPQDKIGSITHTQGLAGAVVACASTHCGLGLDVECIDRKIQPQLMERVSNHKEQEELMHEPYGLLKLLSAKEAVFKACYPLDGVYLGFLDAECLLKRDGFSVRLLKSVHPNIPVGFEFDVLQTVDQGYLFSGCELHTSLLFT